MTIVDASRIYVQISVTEDIVNNIYKGQEVKLNISSVKEENFIGKVDSVSPTADARTQLFPVKIYIDNKEGLIKPGMFSEVRIKTDIREDVIAIKSEAVIERNGKFYVYVTEDDKAVEKEVTVGLDAGVYIEIINGITVSLFKLPIDLLPKIEIPIAVVSTNYAGVGPEEIENMITKPIEEAIGTVANIDKLTSTSSEGNSVVIIFLVEKLKKGIKN